MDASRRNEHLPDTISDQKRFILDWAVDPKETRNVLWFYGDERSGKSTLATAVADDLRQRGLLGAFVFFEQEDLEHNDPVTVIRTVAYQVGIHHKEAGIAIASMIERFPNVSQFPLRSQFQYLLVDALAAAFMSQEDRGQNDNHRDTSPRAEPRPQHVVIVLDGLGDCGSPTTRRPLLDILAIMTAEVPYLRFLVTSCPENDIQTFFSFREHILAQELHTSSRRNSLDTPTDSQFCIDEMTEIVPESPSEEIDLSGELPEYSMLSKILICARVLTFFSHRFLPLVYYKIYDIDSKKWENSRVPAVSNIPSIGRVDATKISPPHTVFALVEMICDQEGRGVGIDWDYEDAYTTILFKNITSPTQYDLNGAISLLGDERPGKTQQDPMILKVGYKGEYNTSKTRNLTHCCTQSCVMNLGCGTTRVPERVSSRSHTACNGD